jgi:hypothetical protein
MIDLKTESGLGLLVDGWLAGIGHGLVSSMIGPC